MSAGTRSSRLSPWIGYPLAVLIGFSAYASWIYVPLAMVKWRGNAPDCTWSSLLAVPHRAILFERRQEELKKQLRQLGADEKLGIVQIYTPERTFWIPRGGSELDGPHLLSYLLVDHETMTLSPTEHVKQGDTVIDVGAHVGVFTHFALKNGAAKVLMLEPDPVNAECLRRNFKKELASGRVILLQEGAWDTQSSMVLHTGVANSGSGSLVVDQVGSQSVEVRVRPIDQMVTELGLPRIDMIKIDIEGAERHALTGAKSVLAQWKPRILMDMYHLPDDPIVLPRVILRANPAYRAACQTCEFRADDGRAVPHVMLFF